MPNGVNFFWGVVERVDEKNEFHECLLEICLGKYVVMMDYLEYHSSFSEGFAEVA